MMTLIAAAGCLLCTVSAASAEAPQASLASSKLKWQVRRTATERAAAHQAAATAPNETAAPAQAIVPAETTVQAQPASAASGPQLTAEPPAPRALRQVSARQMPSAAPASGAKVRGQVVQVSDDKFDPFKDPFSDEKVPAGPAGEPVERTAQPVSQPTSPFDTPSASEPATEPATEPVPEPLNPPATAEPANPSADEPPRLRTDADPFPSDTTTPSQLDDLEPIVPGTAPPTGRMSCDSYKSECRTAIEALRQRDITKIIFGIVIESDEGHAAVEGRDYPCECLLGLNSTFQDRNWAPTTFTWKSSNLCHKPLYFEEVQLERYGHSWNPVVQPFASAAHFFVSVPLLPYKMGLNPPCECMYTLGYYRPGSCAPYMIEPIPLSLRAAAFEAIGATAFAFWFWPPPSGP